MLKKTSTIVTLAMMMMAPAALAGGRAQAQEYPTRTVPKWGTLIKKLNLKVE